MIEITQEILFDIVALRNKTSKNKPNDRSELDRHFAILITGLEKIYAFAEVYLKPCNKSEE